MSPFQEFIGEMIVLWVIYVALTIASLLGLLIGFYERYRDPQKKNGILRQLSTILITAIVIPFIVAITDNSQMFFLARFYLSAKIGLVVGLWFCITLCVAYHMPPANWLFKPRTSRFE